MRVVLKTIVDYKIHLNIYLIFIFFINFTLLLDFNEINFFKLLSLTFMRSACETK